MSSINNTVERYLAVVDLGTSKTGLAVASVEGQNTQILYYKAVPSDGIRNSAIINPLRTESVLRELIADAEGELGLKITQVAVSLPKYGVHQENAQAECTRNDPDECISVEEIDCLKSLAMDDHRQMDKEEIYVAVAKCFSTPDYFQVSESDIVGMISTEITGHFNLFIGKRCNINTLYRVFNDIKLAIADMYFPPIATARAVLTDEEMQNGVALIEMGAGTTSVSIYRNRVLAHYAAIPFGGASVTSDIRNECSISERLAESIKCAYGGCMPDRMPSLSEKIIQIESEDINVCNQIPITYLSEIISAREKEIVDAMLYEISESGLARSLRKGIVITGGGAEMMNISTYIRELSGYTVRTGSPRNGFVATGFESIFKPASAAVAGMVLLARDGNLNCCVASDDIRPLHSPVSETSGKDEVRPDPVEPLTESEASQPADVPEEAAGDDSGRQDLPGQENQDSGAGPAGDTKQEDVNKKGFFRNIVWKVQEFYDNISKESV
ncbi:MAG: cell division protein FtsA [Bacteroidales bacterium]|nr:cell division protein FtsA [Bacteroidales bacterium]